jgi:hypothetical protein
MKPGQISGLFVRFGSFIPNSAAKKLSIIGERISLGNWYKATFEQEIKIVSHRFDLLQIGCNELHGDFAYLEFGVAAGDSMRFVAKSTINSSNTELHGFDTFTGLPESHQDSVMMGSFNQNGLTPDIPGVFWHKGLFSETFTGQEDFLTRKLFVMFDADLYSSTKYVLNKIGKHLKPGDLMYFDDLHIPNQERLALSEALVVGLDLNLVARSNEGRSALFRVSSRCL